MQWLYNNIYLWILSFLFICINMNCDSNGPLLVHVTIVVPKLKNGSNNFLFHLCWFCLFVLWLLVFFVWLLALMNLRTIYNFFFALLQYLIENAIRAVFGNLQKSEQRLINFFFRSFYYRTSLKVKQSKFCQIVVTLFFEISEASPVQPLAHSKCTNY